MYELDVKSLDPHKLLRSVGLNGFSQCWPLVLETYTTLQCLLQTLVLRIISIPLVLVVQHTLKEAV